MRTPATTTDVGRGAARHAGRELVDGLLAPWRGGVYLLRRPRLWGWVAAPVAITAVMLVLALWVALSWTPGLLREYVPPPPGDSLFGALEDGIWTLLAAALEAMVFLVAAVVLWVCGGFISRPFYEALGARVEAEAHGVEAPPVDVSTALTDMGIGFLHSVASLVVYALALLLLALFGLIPGIGEIVGTVGGALVTSAFLARELFDLPLARRRMPLAERLAFLWDHKAACLGLGGISALLLMVPGLNFLSMPVAVVGATLLYGRLAPELAS